jgi:hypoxanthine-DNA glycosylase
MEVITIQSMQPNLIKTSFPPLIHPNARILILGTLPGEESLKQQQYYANPRNQFWRIMQMLFDIPSTAPYTERIAHLKQHKIALWDVLHSCERTGSLDSAILNPIPNDFTGLLAKNPDLQAIAFNGTKAAKWFHRWAKIDTSGLKLFPLPSTSPAATIAFEKKCAAWTILKGLL